MRMELDAGGVYIVLKAPSNAATTVRQIPGARHDAKRQTWLLPVSWATCVVSRAVIGDQLQVGPRLREWAVRERAGRIAPAMVLRDAKAIPPTSMWEDALNEVEADADSFLARPVMIQLAAVEANTVGPATPEAGTYVAPPRVEVRARDEDVVHYTDLDDSDQWWWSVWQGMPEYIHSNISPLRSLTIHFAQPSDIEDFARLMQQTITAKTKSLWHPQQDIAHFMNKRYIAEEVADESTVPGVRDLKVEGGLAPDKQGA